MADPEKLQAKTLIPPRTIYQLHYTEQDGRWGYPCHDHCDYCDLIFLQAGRLEQSINGAPVPLRNGSMCLIREGDRHSLTGRGIALFNLTLRWREIAAAADYLGWSKRAKGLLKKNAPVFELTSEQSAMIRTEMQSLLMNQQSPTAAASLRLFLVRWFVEIVGPNVQKEPDLPEWMQELIDYLETHVEASVMVQDLSRISGRSSEHIARSFRRYLSQTPSQAINAARLRRAALLLAHTDRDILDICFSLGFNSASYFYRLFQKSTGLPPRRYRLKHHPLFRKE